MTSVSWGSQAATPHPALLGMVAGCYVGASQSLMAHRSWLVPARMTVTVRLHITGPPAGLPGAFAVGPGSVQSLDTGEADGVVSWLGVRITPLGARTIFGASLEEITGQVVYFTDLAGAAGEGLASSVREATGWPERFALLDAFLLGRAAQSKLDPQRETTQAWRTLVATGGQVSIGLLASESGLSRKQLIARFRTEFGLTPKHAARLVRFRSLLRRLDSRQCHAANRWPQLAHECGYYDQAHLHRDFREFSGTTPERYFRGALPCGCVDTAAA